MPLAIPPSVKREHDELHRELKTLTRSSRMAGAAAIRLEQVMAPHFRKEEEFALPPLGLLPELARGETDPGMTAVFPLTDRLKEDLPAMLREHQQILAALEELETAALQEGNGPAMRFVEKLKLHARQEEEIMYPAAILAGECLRSMLKNHQRGNRPR